jgi:cytochrome c oxidase subunit 4
VADTADESASAPFSPSRTPPPSTGDEHKAHHGAGRYFLIWGILLGFTVLTVATGRTDLGSANLPIAMAIATIKATLVVLFFMHLSESNGVNRLVFVVSLVFVLVLMTGVFGDLLTRNPLSLPNGIPTSEGPEISVPPPQE